MDRTLVARQLLRLAKDILAIDFPTKEQMDKYLDEHPGADKSNHRVVEKAVRDIHINKEELFGKDIDRMHEIGRSFPSVKKVVLKIHKGIPLSLGELKHVHEMIDNISKPGHGAGGPRVNEDRKVLNRIKTRIKNKIEEVESAKSE